MLHSSRKNLVYSFVGFFSDETKKGGNISVFVDLIDHPCGCRCITHTQEKKEKGSAARVFSRSLTLILDVRNEKKLKGKTGQRTM
jgi:hypothetical protein